MIRLIAVRVRQYALICLVAGLSACSSDSADPPTRTIDGVAAEPADRSGELRYDREFPVIGYSQRTPHDAVSVLAERINNGSVELSFDAQRGYLDALLDALDIDPTSQLLVFSKTSLQVDGVTAATPRAIYFNDDVYVAWVPGADSIELAALDAELGPVFYTLSQASTPVAERHVGLCLSCHDSYSMTGGGVPRFITGSGYVGKDGTIVAHEGWILTSDRTPLRSRWGGWYVSGMHGEQTHLGNIAVDSVYDLEDLESLRNGNHLDVAELLDVSAYITDKSDIVALLILEHQVTVQNAIVRLNWDFRQEREFDVEPLVRALLFDGTPALSGPISGTAGFEAVFAARAVEDSRGRSLREFDLESRLFRYPLSYVIHSPAFAALPNEALRAVLFRIESELTGQDAKIEDLPGDAASRAAAWEILLDTRPEFASMMTAR